MSSGDDIEAGRITTGESTTDLVGAIPSEQDVDFNGVVVFRVGPQQGRLSPTATLDGIHGLGSNGPGRTGGTGVVGFGGPDEGPGVVGHGGGIEGTGGPGVHGIGGSVIQPNFTPTIPAGPGIVGQGGRVLDNLNDLRLSHGAGVVAIAGGKGFPLPPSTETGSIGVFAVGAEAKVQTVSIDGQPTVVGPLAPGAGVLGRGGLPVPGGPGEGVAAGVIGLAGGTSIPPFDETANSAVYGGGPVGVNGAGAGAGVLGRSPEGRGVRGETDSGEAISGKATGAAGRGGVFTSTLAAQIRLIPRNLISGSGNLPSAAIIPICIAVGKQEGPELPKTARDGDLMAIIGDQSNQCSLWFCVIGGGGPAPARWAQVLVGQAFDGRA